MTVKWKSPTYDGGFSITSYKLYRDKWGYIADMNIKFQDNSIHFIQYLNRSNKLYKYSEDNE